MEVAIKENKKINTENNPKVIGNNFQWDYDKNLNIENQIINKQVF